MRNILNKAGGNMIGRVLGKPITAGACVNTVGEQCFCFGGVSYRDNCFGDCVATNLNCT
jgi:hypothetical protein